MNLGDLHVVAACTALVLGLLVLRGRKGDWRHVALGRVFLVLMLLVNVPVLFLHEATGRPGPFHVLALVSLTTTALGWLALRRGPRGRIGVHAALMTWSSIGVATAGLAQLANAQWPAQSPWPVVTVVGVTTALGLAVVPRYVAGQLRPTPAPRSTTRRAGGRGGPRR